jgi:hypothetical protein
MTMTWTEILGFLMGILDILKEEKLALIKGGMDVDLMSAEIAHALEEARAANDIQESHKRQLKTSTTLVEERMRRAYVVGSSALDMAMGAVSKDSPAAKNFQRIRSKIRREKKGIDVIVQPTPIPTAEPMK